jgi:hypothetical protein
VTPFGISPAYAEQVKAKIKAEMLIALRILFFSLCCGLIKDAAGSLSSCGVAVYAGNPA